MRYWLFKTEPDEYSVEDLRREDVSPWEGIRNFQARKRLSSEVKPGDRVFIYHSSCKTPAVVGLAEVVSGPEPDPTQFDPASPYHDEKSNPARPRWVLVRVRFLETFSSPVTLKTIKSMPVFSDLELVTRPRLSIQQVPTGHAERILAMARA